MKSLIVICLIFTCSIAAAQTDEEYRVPNQFIVMLKPGHGVQELVKGFDSLEVSRCVSARMNIFLINRSASSSDDDFLAVLRKHNAVKLAQFNHHIKLRGLVPNDTFFNLQWNMFNTGQGGGTPGDDINATEAWQINHNNLTVNGDTIVVAIVDAGFDLTHPDINFYINHHEIPNNGIDDDSNGYVDDYLGWNTIVQGGPNGDVNADPYPHSMHVSGIAAAIGDNNIGVAGVCWGAQVMRICGASQTEDQVVEAYAYIVVSRALYDSTNRARGAYVVSTNSSFGVGNGGAQPADYPIWCAMYDTMGAYGIVSAAAGPDAPVDVDQVGDVPTGCPSKYLITVTNIDDNDQLNSYAGYGKVSIDIGAPGTNIFSTLNNNGYGYMTGTSMSSPHLAGTVAALYAAACPQLIDDSHVIPDSVARAVRRMILSGAQQTSAMFNITASNGELNLYRSVRNLDEYNCEQCNFSISINVTPITCSDSCNGSAVITVTGPGVSAQNVLTGLCPGFYSYIYTDPATDCSRTANFSIAKPDSIVISSIQTIPVVAGDAGNIIVNASAGNYNLEYSVDSVNYTSSSTLVVQSNGNYTVYVQSQSGCVVTQNVTLTGIQDELVIGNDISIYPNPASNQVNVALSLSESAATRFTLYDMPGNIILDETKQIPSGLHHAYIDVSSFAEGVYLLRISAGNAAVFRKVVISR